MEPQGLQGTEEPFLAQGLEEVATGAFVESFPYELKIIFSADHQYLEVLVPTLKIIQAIHAGNPLELGIAEDDIGALPGGVAEEPVNGAMEPKELVAVIIL